MTNQKLIKLTSPYRMTRGPTEWRIGRAVSIKPRWRKAELCTPGVLLGSRKWHVHVIKSIGGQRLRVVNIVEVDMCELAPYDAARHAEEIVKAVENGNEQLIKQYWDSIELEEMK